MQKYLYLKVFKYIFKVFVFVFRYFQYFSQVFVFVFKYIAKVFVFSNTFINTFFFFYENCYNYNQYIHDIYKHMNIHSQTDKQALKGVSSMWRSMYMQTRHIK